MHSTVISKVEYRQIGDENFTVADIIPESGVMNEDTDDTANGPLNKISVQFNIAAVSVATDTPMKKLRGRKLQFRLTDTNGLVHLVGDENYCARLSYQKTIDRTPGSFNGYRCKGSCNSPSGSSVS